MESEWTFEGVASKTILDVTFPAGTAAGAKAWFTAFWFNSRKQNGPAASPVSRTSPAAARWRRECAKRGWRMEDRGWR